MASTINNTASCELCDENANLQVHHHEGIADKIQIVQDELNATRETMNHLKENIKEHPLIKTINDWEKKSILKIQQLAEDRRQILQYHITEHLSTMEKSWKNVEMKMQGLLEEQEFDKNYVYQCNTELKQLKTQINTSLDIVIQEDLTPFIPIVHINSSGVIKNTTSTRRPFYESISHCIKTIIDTRQTTKEYHHFFKVIVVGDSKAGKTCFLRRFTRNEFDSGAGHAIGIEFDNKIIQIDKAIIKLQIWDTISLNRYVEAYVPCYRHAQGILVVYDINRRETFQNVNKWLQRVRDNAPSGIVLLLVGTKCDDQVHRSVSRIEAEAFAEKNGMLFIETSAINEINVEKAFHMILAEIYYKKLNKKSK